MPKRKEKHLHRYKRAKLGKNNYIIYKCMVPSCTHYIGRDLVEGNLCACNRCGEPMVMDKFAMSLAKPHCHSCTERKDKDVEKLTELFA